MQGNPIPTPDQIGAQPLDADLTAYAALSTTGLVERTGAGTVGTVTATTFAKTLLDDADAATARTTLGAAAASHTQAWSTITSTPTTLAGYGIADAQPLDADLTALAGLATTGVIERTGAGTAATFTVTSFAKNLLDDPDAATARTTLELGSISTQSASNVAITGGSISGITDLAIADGGTGSSTAQGAINALAGAVTSGQYLRGNGTNVVMSAIQASDVPTLNQNTTGTAGNVTGIVAVANGGTGANTVPQARTNLGLVIGTDVQAYDADLAAIAALSTTGLIERTGSGTATTRTTGATGLNVLAAATQAAARTAIGAMANTAPEIITNANGTAYRWPNGLQICTGPVGGVPYTNISAVELGRIIPGMYHYNLTITPPATFVSASSFGYGVDNNNPGVLLVGSATSISYVARTGPTAPSIALYRLVWIGTYTP